MFLFCFDFFKFEKQTVCRNQILMEKKTQIKILHRSPGDNFLTFQLNWAKLQSVFTQSREERIITNVSREYVRAAVFPSVANTCDHKKCCTCYFQIYCQINLTVFFYVIRLRRHF